MLTVAVSGCPDCTGGAFETGERGLLLSSEAARLLISGAWLWKHRLRCDAHELDPSVEATGSHVPYKSLVELRAAYMPDGTWAVSGRPPS
jgi:hypothetical protein